MNKINFSMVLKSCARKAVLLGTVAFVPLTFAQTAQAQSCTAAQISNSSNGFEGRDASGNPAGFDGNDVQVGDFLVFSDTVIAGYNPAARADVVFEITGINLNSAVPPHSADSNRVTVNNNGRLTLQGAISMSDPYVTYRVLPMFGGSVTSTVASGTPLSLINTEVSLQDVDSLTTRNASDVAGIANANPGNFTVSLTDTAQIDFQNGGGPAGFTTYTHTPISLSPVSWDGAVSGGNLDHTVDLSYPTFTGGEYLHGFTGFETNSNTRGAIVGLCGEIAEPELTTSKTLNSVVQNADGTTDVSYTINVENTGDQLLTGLSLTDDLDTVFSTSYDAFTPSTSADISGGVIAQDAVATIITDSGNPIGSLATNLSFNGGSDINLFNPSNTISLDQGDEIALTFVIHLNANETGSDATFTNVIDVTMTDEFSLPVTSNSSSSPVEIAPVQPLLSLTKVADDATDRKPGETITYRYTVVNTGNVPIDDVTVSDVHNGTGSLSAIVIDALTNTSGDSADDGADNDIDVLAPNDSVTFEATYVVTEADVTAGGNITNTATVTGDPTAGSLPATPITADESVSVVPLEVELSLTKTNTPGTNGEVDQIADTLTSGDTTTYMVSVTNNGPDSVAGALVTDTVVEGLSCNAADVVTISGDGVPTGSFTIGDLTGSGITLATLANGESATMTYSCLVN